MIAIDENKVLYMIWSRSGQGVESECDGNVWPLSLPPGCLRLLRTCPNSSKFIPKQKSFLPPYKIGPDSQLTIESPILKSAVNQAVAFFHLRLNLAAAYFSTMNIPDPSFWPNDEILLFQVSLIPGILIQLNFQLFDTIQLIYQNFTPEIIVQLELVEWI